MDETGVMLGHLCKAKRVVATDVPTPYRRAPQTRELATILKCVSTTGRAIKPMVIVTAKKPSEQLVPYQRHWPRRMGICHKRQWLYRQ